MERVRQQFLVSARNDEQEPESIASRAWMKLAFGDQLYARKSSGTPAVALPPSPPMTCAPCTGFCSAARA